jgi:DNA mismatch repair ATPase MutS
VPIGQAAKVPRGWNTKSQKKTHRRYWTAFIESALAELAEAEERAAAAERDTMRSIFEKFDQERETWSAAVLCASVLDALLSLALVSSSPGYVWAELASRQQTHTQTQAQTQAQTPTHTETPTHTHTHTQTGTQPYLHVTAGRHPMLEHSLVQRGVGDYIPNDLTLGAQVP